MEFPRTYVISYGFCYCGVPGCDVCKISASRRGHSRRQAQLLTMEEQERDVTQMSHSPRCPRMCTRSSSLSQPVSDTRGSRRPCNPASLCAPPQLLLPSLWLRDHFAVNSINSCQQQRQQAFKYEIGCKKCLLFLQHLPTLLIQMKRSHKYISQRGYIDVNTGPKY